MNANQVLVEGFGRIHDVVHRAVDGLGEDDLARRLDGSSNSIAWLVWHLTRIQDDHLAGVTGAAQVWTEKGWAEQFGLSLPASDTGYGHSDAEVAAVRAGAEQLTGYFDAVHERTLEYLAGLSEADYDRVVDERWDPPVTLGVRLVSVLSDDLQHAGQAMFVRGMI